jgi:hypothetical protein
VVNLCHVYLLNVLTQLRMNCTLCWYILNCSASIERL